jgi:DNA-binding transcriptional ArsR family regulator
MDDDQLDLVFGALADRTRRAILARLAETDSNVGDLTALFTMSQPAVSRHLKVLEQAGLVSRNRQGTMRLSHLEAEPLKEATGWLGGYREYWGASYARLDELLASLPPAPDETRAAGTQEKRSTRQGEVR